MSVFLAATAGIYYIVQLPVADVVDPADAALRLKAEGGDTLLLRPPIAAAGATVPLLTVLGEGNEGVDVHVEDGALDAATAAELREVWSLALPATRGPINWTTTARGNGRSRIDIGLRAAPHAMATAATAATTAAPGRPEVEFAQAGSGSAAALRVRVRNAVAVLRLTVLLGDEAAAGGQHSAPAERNVLRIGSAGALKLPGALPIGLEVSEGRAIVLVFPVGAPAGRFYLGEGAEGPGVGEDAGVAVRDVGLRRRDGSYKWYACSAGKGRLFPWPRAPGPDDCAANPTLRAHHLALAPEQVALRVDGAGFVVSDGVARGGDWLARLERYKLPAALLGLCYSALANWVWQVCWVRRRAAA
ncbi:hypothetical protein ACFOLJ_23015 [Rugamonas sp. CCM 8940]|uniref:hypothetical protein n=1 Tax=Rugamonas sp. CCM 8940 TaxID=2765359 RepID=UPI0018F576C8|nr:hypothetical protein [Rugamonas sp. CCM 8940]MBJ7312478.1 hypothetical protein [Rugamonas sp. CCM 8940]